MHLHGGSCYGGIESSILGLAAAHRLHGIEHCVATSADGEFWDRLGECGVPRKRLQRCFPRRRLLRKKERQYWRNLRRLVYEWRPDVIHVSRLGVLGRCWLLPWLTRVPVVVHIPGAVRREALTAEVRDGLRGVREILCVSAFVKRTFEEHWSGQQEVRVVYNGVDVAARVPETPSDVTRASLGIEEQDIVVGVFANFARVKKHETFIRAAATLGDFANLKFFIVGGPGMEPAYLDEVQELAEEVNAPIQFLGFQKEAASYMAAADIIVLCTEGEGFGNVLIEAMAQGKAVLAARSGGCPEVVVDGETGMLFRVGDHETLARQIAKLAKNQEMRKRMGQAGRKRAEEHFSLERHATQMADCYARAIAKGGRPYVERGGMLIESAFAEVGRTLLKRTSRWLSKRPAQP